MKPKEAGNVFKAGKPQATPEAKPQPVKPVEPPVQKPKAKQDEWLSVWNDRLFTPVGEINW